MRIRPPVAPQNGFNNWFIKGLKPMEGLAAYEVPDRGETRYLRIRVTRRSKCFYIRARWEKGTRGPTSRLLGRWSETPREGFMTLAQAREKARVWDGLRRLGHDPRHTVGEIKPEGGAAMQKDLTKIAKPFSEIVEAYLARPDFLEQRQRAKSEGTIRREILSEDRNKWANKGIASISPTDIWDLIENIRDRPARNQAIHALSHLRLIFSFALLPKNRELYGIDKNPLAEIEARHFGLIKKKRLNSLEKHEVAAFFRASTKLGYPYGPLFQMLLLTGSRKAEIADSSWTEMKLAERLFIVPAHRFKSNRNHVVPLSDLVMGILADIPRFTGEHAGSFIFSVTNGKRPVNGFSKAKQLLNEYMIIELREIAEKKR